MTPLRAATLDLLHRWGPLTDCSLAWAWRSDRDDCVALVESHAKTRWPPGTPPFPVDTMPERWPSEQVLRALVRDGYLVYATIPGTAHARPSRMRPARVWATTPKGYVFAEERADRLNDARNEWNAAAHRASKAYDVRGWPEWLAAGWVHEAPSPWPGVTWFARPTTHPGDGRKAWDHGFRRTADGEGTSSIVFAEVCGIEAAPGWLREQGERLGRGR